MSSIPDVAESARFVTEQADTVTIDDAAVAGWAELHRGDAFAVPAPPTKLRFNGSASDTANFILLIDCLNFCFWSDRPWSIEYGGQTWTRTYAMYAGLLRAIDDDRSWLAAQRWADLDLNAVTELFAGSGQIPLLEERRQVLNETGRCLIDAFDGQFIHAVEQVGGHAVKLAYLLAERFESFADVHSYDGRSIAILKRAQICAADLHHAWTRQGYPGLTGLESLTVFADYRLPQYLRHVGILKLIPELAERIDAHKEIPSASPEEIELRCTSIEASRRLVHALSERGTHLACYQIDYTLWERSHDPHITIPHHRTRCIYY